MCYFPIFIRFWSLPFCDFSGLWVQNQEICPWTNHSTPVLPITPQSHTHVPLHAWSLSSEFTWVGHLEVCAEARCRYTWSLVEQQGASSLFSWTFLSRPWKFLLAGVLWENVANNCPQECPALFQCVPDLWALSSTFFNFYTGFLKTSNSIFSYLAMYNFLLATGPNTWASFLPEISLFLQEFAIMRDPATRTDT